MIFCPSNFLYKVRSPGLGSDQFSSAEFAPHSLQFFDMIQCYFFDNVIFDPVSVNLSFLGDKAQGKYENDNIVKPLLCVK